ncbi:hypothetical protein [Sporofaciens musculi]|uniref:hypothetical protein n=1 Tax=Sporofaciens musculi TaxID=2681861 RepID=UPI00259D079C|nr:hypothetical protein [Sporofaciens musculi]
MAKRENVVKRSLYYYDFTWKVYNKSKEKFIDVKRKDEKFKNFLECFKFKKNEAAEKKYILTTEKGDNLFIITDKVSDEMICFRIVLCKTNALPLVENGGNLEDLETYIDEKKNIAEVTHCVYFRDSEIVGAEFNFNGARVSALNWYLPKILHIDGDVETLYNVKFTPKINGDAYEKLAKNETLTLFELHFKPDSEAYKNVLANTSLFRGAVKSVPDAEVIEIAVKRRKTKKNSYTGINDILEREQLKTLSQNYREDIKKLYVSQGAYSDGVDLLADKLVTKVDIIRTKKRTIDSKDAYKKIKEFYQEEIKP